MDKNKQAALARALEQIEKLPKSEVRVDEPFRARYRGQRLKSQDTTCQATTCHTETDIAFFAECAERAGVELKDWLDSEPF